MQCGVETLFLEGFSNYWWYSQSCTTYETPNSVQKIQHEQSKYRFTDSLYLSDREENL